MIMAFYFQINLHVNDLFTDLSDGKILIRLLETISGEKIGAPGNILYYSLHCAESCSNGEAYHGNWSCYASKPRLRVVSPFCGLRFASGLYK